MTKTTTKRERRTEDARQRLLDPLSVAERGLEPSGISTPALEGGDGQPIVLLHGPGESAFLRMRVVPDPVTTHRVIVPDLPGHGASGVTVRGGLDGSPNSEQGSVIS